MLRFASILLLASLLIPSQRPNTSPVRRAEASVLRDAVLVTWYGNPRTGVTIKKVLPAYQLVAVVATCTEGADKRWRRRETADVIQALLDDAHAHGFKLILDIQPGRSTVADEVAALRPFLSDPDVYLALDPEFAMTGCEIPGQHIGQMAAADINAALTALEDIIAKGHLPPKVLILHQFRLDTEAGRARICRHQALL